jgi:septal ring factor EnvC (AmiA/AmiB activator)
MMDLNKQIKLLEERIKKLEEENIETTNVLYEILNTLDSYQVSETYLNQKWHIKTDDLC